MNMQPEADPVPTAQRTIAVDFDGVIHTYSDGWHDGTIYDEPMPGAAAGLKELSEVFRVVIITSRAVDPDNVERVWKWLRSHRMDGYVDKVTNRKVPAVAYIDDRAVRFTNWNDIRKLWR